MEKPNNWDDVEDILYDGSQEEIEQIVCPDCGSKIQYRYGLESTSFEIRCLHCGYISRATGSPKPKCVSYFGNEHQF